MQGLSIAAYFFILSTTVLEPDLGRLIIAHSDQRELWGKKKQRMRARFRAIHAGD